MCLPWDCELVWGKGVQKSGGGPSDEAFWGSLSPEPDDGREDTEADTAAMIKSQGGLALAGRPEGAPLSSLVVREPGQSPGQYGPACTLSSDF